jgi:hypothetical protein
MPRRADARLCGVLAPDCGGRVERGIGVDGDTEFRECRLPVLILEGEGCASAFDRSGLLLDCLLGA